MDKAEERKIKARARAKLWAAANKERYRENQARWCSEHHDKLIEYGREYWTATKTEQNEKRRRLRKENPEIFREQKKRSYRKNPAKYIKASKDAKAKNPDHYRKIGRAYRQRNRQRLDQQGRKWREKNPERTKQIHDAAAHNRRVREIAVGKITADDVKRIRAAKVCAACGCSHPRMEIDHIIPLSKGGTNHFSNLQLLCRPCNRSKHNRNHAEWLATQLTVKFLLA